MQVNSQETLYRRTTFSFMLVLSFLSLFCLSATPLHAAPDKAAIKKSVQKGVKYLRKNFEEIPSVSKGYKSLVALALFKGGEPTDSKEIQSAIRDVLDKIKDGKYNQGGNKYHIYAAGVDLMLLVDTSGEKYKPEVEAIVNYVVEQQHEEGFWAYYDDDMPDTSITQYALLGLWAASRIGVKVPIKTYDKAAKWHLDVQTSGGGLAYNPGTENKDSNYWKPKLNMTVGGTGSMLISQLHLYPNGATKNNSRKKKYGVLEKISLDGKKKKAGVYSDENYKKSVSSIRLEQGVTRGLRWVNTQFRPAIEIGLTNDSMYYYYGLERMTALANRTTFQGDDWFDVCSREILNTQKSDGSWDNDRNRFSATCFAILCLTRSTAKLLGRPVGKLGTGLLAGGRGLPDDLGRVSVQGGKVEMEKLNDPLAELLAELEKPNAVSVDDLQTSVIEKIQVGDPEELLGQRKKLLKLATNKNADLRRVALWALGRTGNISDARVMVDALGKDDNIGVLIEARNALCYMSHKANGFGSPTNPLHKLTEEASQSEKDKAMARWRAKVYKDWVRWYLKIRPYDEQNDFLELDLSR